MQNPKRFSDLPEYAFPRLRTLLDGRAPGGDVLHMSIGEPKHKFPAFITDIIAKNAAGFNRYPPNDGTPALLSSIARWLERRFELTDFDESNRILPLNGTREGLFNAALALSPEEKNGKQPLILLPNPFYQCYMVAARAAGAKPVFVNAGPETGFLPDFAGLPEKTLAQTSIVYICSPSNPQGAVATRAYYHTLINLAEKHDFRIFADECYSEIYREQPPVGILSVAQEIGADPERILAFHSLSKRSNLPGFRSGFVAAGPKAITDLRQLRAYTGAPIPLPIQIASAAVWRDEDHVAENRRLYRQKFDLADEILGNTPGYMSPKAGFFLWLKVSDGEQAVVDLWKSSGVRALPGAYLAQDTDAGNPGKEYIRIALVAEISEIERGLRAVKNLPI